MKGIVFTEFLTMVEERWSIEFAEELIESVDLPSGGAYTAVGTYDHSEMSALVTQLSVVTETPVPTLLRVFGHYLFGRFAVLYPVFFEGVTSSIDLVASIDGVIHVEVRKLYPDAELPRFFTLESTPDLLTVEYQSDRHLGDLAEGLIEAAIEHFEEKETVILTRKNTEPEGPVCFTLRRMIP